MTRNEIQTQIEAATYTLPETRDLGEVRIETSLLTPEAKRYLSERNRLDVERVLEQFGMAHA